MDQSAPAFAAPLLGEVPPPPVAIPPALQAALADRYAITREIGRGGMAVVYLATDLRHRREVALKVLPAERLLDGDGGRHAARFEREIGFAARLSHPNILPLHDSGVAAGALYYVTPYAPQESLREQLQREGRLSVTDAMRVLRDVTRALAHAHAHGVVHRDIKPGNILFGRDGDALVGDFGIAKLTAEVVEVDASHDVTLTARGLVLGTPTYLAPEQIGDTDAVDHRADLYALGVVAYEMLAGVPPFASRRPHELLVAHLTEAPPPLATRRHDLPTGLAELVHRLLAKRPEERCFDASEVLQALDAVERAAPRPPAAPTSPPQGGRTASPGTQDAEAAAHLLKGRFLVNTRQREALRSALAQFEAAVALDPGFAEAHAAIADVHVLQGLFGMARPRDALRLARAAADRALAIAPDLVEARAALAHALTLFGWEWDRAEAEFAHVISGAPAFAPARMYYAAHLHSTGRASEALAQLEVARTLDPLIPIGMLSGRVYVDRHQPDAALAVLLEEVRLDPRRDVAHQLLGHAYLQKGMAAEAVAAMERAAALSGPRDTAQLAYVRAVTGDVQVARELLAPLEADRDAAAVLGFHLAMAHAGLGEIDAAFEWLEAGYRERGSFMSVLAVSVGFDRLRADPRFPALLERMGLGMVVRPQPGG
jgi:serine/threonine-protein kinase